MCKPLSIFAAVIFVVDSSNKERMEESHAELVKLMTEKRLSDALLLVYANKQVNNDKPGFSGRLESLHDIPFNTTFIFSGSTNGIKS